MTIDPRLIERRKAVAEDRAKRSVGRLLKFLALTLVAGALVWAVLSPWMSINQVRTAGIVLSDANQILSEHRVIAGTPLITLRAGQVEQALAADPWVREARVHLDWPDEVIVRIEERKPVAWFQTSGGWSRRDIEGVSVPSAQIPDGSLPKIRLQGIADTEAEKSPFVLGAAEFVETLTPLLYPGLEMRVEAGELWVVASGVEVRLGRPVEMRAKALSLEAILNESVPENSTIILIAPSHPAVSPPALPSDDGEAVAPDNEDDQP
ncbi:MAG: FtsQ-type POTRA domain-containing protein [Actinomycetota bacterium]|nr:FtsQ-type POTRA domain-containing protein [Actinomycetota bacterium]